MTYIIIIFITVTWWEVNSNSIPYIYIYIYTHTHMHIYIYIYIYIVVNIWSGSKPFIKIVLKPKSILVLGQLWWTFLIHFKCWLLYIFFIHLFFYICVRIYIYIYIYIYTHLYFLKVSCSTRLNLFDQKYNKNSNIVKYYYNLNEPFSICIYFEM